MNYLPLLLLLSLSSLLSCSQLEKESQFSKFHFHKKWTRSTLSKNYLGFRHLHRAQPLLTPSLVIASNTIDGVSAFDRKTGHKIWKLHIKFGSESSAELIDDTLFFGASDGHFYSVNVETGQINWSFPIRSEGLSSPAVNGPFVYFLAGNNTLYALDKKTGQKKWLYSRNEFKSLSIRGGSQPVIHGKNLYIGFSDGYFVSLNALTGQIHWEKQLNSNRRFMDVDATPVIHKDRIYISGFDDELFCLNLSDGNLVWRVDAGGFNKVLIQGEKIIYPTSQKKLMVLDRKSGKTLWEYSINDGFATTPIFYKGLIIFGESEGELKALDLQSQKLIAKFNPGRGVSSTPTIDKNTGEIYFMSRGANLFALKILR